VFGCRKTYRFLFQWKYRYLHTNAVSETFAIATFRNLPRCHPVYKLLRPHLRSVVQVNQDAREDAIAEDSDINGCVSLSELVDGCAL